MAGSFAGCGHIVSRHAVKVDVPADPIQKDGGNLSFAQLLEHRGVVPARDKDQPVNLTFDERADSFAFGGKVFLGIRQNDLVIGTGGSLFDAPNDVVKKADASAAENPRDGFSRREMTRRSQNLDTFGPVGAAPISRWLPLQAFGR